MALRTKTIEFATSTVIATLAAATSRDVTLTAYIPESSITFKSVTLQCWVRDNTTTSATMTSPVLGIAPTLGGTYSEVTLSNPPANTGEGQTYFFQRDVTSWMTTNWTGTSMSLGVRFRGTALITANHFFRLVITYQYDDTSATHIKTVRIPIESTRQYATTTWQTLGGATAIPAFTDGSYLPENSVTVRQAFVDLWGNESPAATATDITLSIRINGGTQRDVYFAEQGYTGSGLHFRTGYDITTETTYGSARSLEILVTGVTNRFARTGGMLVITYEFTVSGTSTVLNSLIYGGVDTIGQIPGTTSGDAESWGRTIFIQEPTTITLKESAVCLFAQTAAPAGGTLNVACGDQGTYTGYTMSQTNSFELGPHSLVHRIDAGGQNGTAFESLSRGLNQYELRVYASAANVWWNLSGFMILNYTSGIASAGVGVHAQSRYALTVGNTSTASQGRTVTAAGLLLGTDESNYWLSAVLLELNFDHGSNVAGYSYALNTERAAGEGEGEGWEPLYAGMTASDTERTCTIRIYNASRSSFRRWPLDTDTQRLDLTTSRTWRLDAASAVYSSWGVWATFHCITYTLSGTVSGYTGDGSGITVEAHRSDTDELIGSTTTAAGGTYSLTWYDNTINCYTHARQDSTHVGRSDDGTAA